MTKHRKARLGHRTEQEGGADPVDPPDPVFEGFKKGQEVSIQSGRLDHPGDIRGRG